MEGINISKRPRLKKPYLIVAWPGMGDVAFRAASYLVDKLKATEFAKIEATQFFYSTSSVIESGILKMPALPQSSFFYWKNKTGKNDLIIFVSNAQPDLAKAEEYSRLIIKLAKSFHVQMVVSFASMPLA
ncbi:MAG: PAC2 family protein [Candidatus Omnitrophota bacterium]